MKNVLLCIPAYDVPLTKKAEVLRHLYEGRQFKVIKPVDGCHLRGLFSLRDLEGLAGTPVSRVIVHTTAGKPVLIWQAD